VKREHLGMGIAAEVLMGDGRIGECRSKPVTFSILVFPNRGQIEGLNLGVGLFSEIVLKT
jgi:hypothetical protein